MHHYSFPQASRRGGRMVASTLAAAALVAALAAAGQPAAGAGRQSPAGIRVSAAGPLAAVSQVPLVTGGQVMVIPQASGHPSFVLRPGNTGRNRLAVWLQGPSGDRFIVPAAAWPYLGRGLGLSLFDVSALARDGITTGGRIPVRLDFAAGARPAAPGVTLTSVSGRSARGYLTIASARRFAAALASQADAAAGAARSAGAGRLLRGVESMSLDVPQVPQPAAPAPDVTLHTLQLKVTNESGDPAQDGQVFLQVWNTDNLRLEDTFVPVSNGVARVRVPAGDYSLSASFIDFKNAPGRVVTLDDFKVAAASAATRVSVDERSATSRVSVSTPRPAAVDVVSVLLARFDKLGNRTFAGLLAMGFPRFPIIPVFVNAQPPAKVGKLHYQLWWGGQGTAAGPAYRYDVAFPFDHIPAVEHFTVRASQLATVREHFSADPAAHSGAQTGINIDPVDPAMAPALTGGTGEGTFVQTMPGNLTHFLGSADSGRWEESAAMPNGLLVTADQHTFAAGHSYSLAWAHGPLASVFGRHRGVPAPVLDPRAYPATCLACAAGHTLSLALSPVGDSQLDHATELIAPVSQARIHFTLFRKDTKLFSGTGSPGAVVHNIPRTRATFRAVLDVSFTGIPGFSQSTTTHTDLTVPYTPVASPHTALPAEDTCIGQTTAAPCQILPALTLSYRLAANESNTSTAATQVLHLHVTHIGYDGKGSTARITSAAVSVSFDGGTTFHPVTLTGSDGRYTATWPNPAPAAGTSPMIKVTATDAAGGKITQTITGAYTIASTAQARSTR